MTWKKDLRYWGVLRSSDKGRLHSMPRIAFLILAHDNLHNIMSLIRALVAEDNRVILHIDKKNGRDSCAMFKRLFSTHELERIFFSRQCRVEWGRWSMVEATLACLETLIALTDIDYVYLLSDSDCLIKNVEELKKYLKHNRGANFIECVDPCSDPWVIRGIVHERYQHYHFLNWRKHKQWLPISGWLQNKMGITRHPPQNLKIYFGSQWWCLTRTMALRILEKSRNPQIVNFFKHTWIPDEMYFQTIAASISDPKTFLPSLTYYKFDEIGRPTIYGDADIDLLKAQPHFFARKISPTATTLRSLYEGFKS